MKLKRFVKILGPGLLYAGAAVGVSHLVQSTRAGATYGFDLIWILIIANAIKYPFFEFAPRYASATSNSLISGYEKIGKWAIVLYSFLTLATMFAIQAAVTMVTAGLVAHIFDISIDITMLCGFILGITMTVLIIGKYAILDKIIKFIIVTLALSTIIAVCFAFGIDLEIKPDFFNQFNWKNSIDIAFLIAFIGWMPAPLDVSVWHSLWTVAKKKETGAKTSLKESLIDFKIGYIGTAFLAIGFLTLGALVMYGSGEQLSHDGSIFAKQFINMYTISLGKWAYTLIAIAALTTMFSTTLTCLDAYPRVLKPLTEIFIPTLRKSPNNNTWLSWLWLVILVGGALLLIGVLTSSMRFMVDLATTLSFVTAPVFAIMNYKVITDKHMPKEARPKKWLRIYAIIGIILLCAFTLFYIGWKFIF